MSSSFDWVPNDLFEWIMKTYIANKDTPAAMSIVLQFVSKQFRSVVLTTPCHQRLVDHKNHAPARCQYSFEELVQECIEAYGDCGYELFLWLIKSLRFCDKRLPSHIRSSSLPIVAAKVGAVKILRRLEVAELTEDRVMMTAGEYGQHKVLDMAYSPKSLKISARDASMAFIKGAIRGGHLDLVSSQWISEVATFTIKDLCKSGNLEIVKYVIKRIGWRDPPIGTFIECGANLEIVKWLASEYPSSVLLTADCTRNAARQETPALLKWLRERNCPWNHHTLLSAIEHGRLEVLNWAIENGCPYQNDMFDFSANIIQALKNNADIRKMMPRLFELFPSSYEEMRSANVYMYMVRICFEGQDLETIKFLLSLEKRKPTLIEDYLKCPYPMAIQMLRYLIEDLRCEMPSKECLLYLVEEKKNVIRKDVIRYIHKYYGVLDASKNDGNNT